MSIHRPEDPGPQLSQSFTVEHFFVTCLNYKPYQNTVKIKILKLTFFGTGRIHRLMTLKLLKKLLQKNYMDE